MNVFRALAVFLALSATSVSAWADAPPSSASYTQFLTVSPNDYSAALMGEIIGPVAWQKATDYGTRENIPAKNDVLDGGIIGMLSGVLALACMLLTSLITGWGAIAFNISSAIHGSGAAARYNLFWVPLRTAFSFGMLLPVVGGYTLGQVYGMKAIMLSIGIANAAYNGVLDWFYSGKPTIPIANVKVGDTARSVFLIEACKAGVVDESNNTLIWTPEMGPTRDQSLTSQIAGATSYGLLSRTETYTDTYSASHDGKDGSALPASICGRESVSQTRIDTSHAPGAAAADLFSKRIAALQQLHTDMRAVAQQVVDASVSVTEDGDPSSSSSSTGSATRYLSAEGAYRNAVQKYREALNNAAGAAVAAITTVQTQKYLDGVETDEIKQRFRDGGWIMLGGLYWNMHVQDRAISELVNKADINVVAPDFSVVGNMPLRNEQTWKQVSQAAAIVAAQVDADPATRYVADSNMRKFAGHYGQVSMNPGMASDTLAELNAWIPVNTVTELFMDRVTQDGDLVWGLMQVGNVAWDTGCALVAAQAIGGAILGSSGGSGSNANQGIVEKGVELAEKVWLPRPVTAIAEGLVALASLLAVPMLLIGFALAFYLPAVPLILWMINIVGWFIQCVKMLFALPVFFAALAIPEGDGFTGQYGRRGLFLILGTVLRPILLVSGIMVGAVMVAIVGWLSRFMMPILFASLDITSLPGMMGFLALMAIYSGLMVTLVMKCFSLSHELADEVLEWAGDRAASIGDQHHADSSRNMISGMIAARGADVMGRAGQAAAQRSLTRQSSNAAGASAGKAATNPHVAA